MPWEGSTVKTRTIRPDFFVDPKMGKLSPLARLLFIGTWVAADDEGNVRTDYATLKGLLIYDDKVTISKMASLLDELVSVGVLVPYEVNGDPYATIKAFKKHQYIKHPSSWRNPLPPAGDPAPDPLPDPVGDPPATREEKKRKEKRVMATDVADDFESVWGLVARKERKADGAKAYARALKRLTHEQIEQGIRNYNCHAMHAGTLKEFIKQGATLLSQVDDWVGPCPICAMDGTNACQEERERENT